VEPDSFPVSRPVDSCRHYFLLQGTAQGIREPFTWDLARAAIRLGVNYVGLYDDVGIFNRALSDNEIQTLYQLKNGVRTLHP
jgi:hypothetical protein